MRNSSRVGFTLIEVIIVVTVMGLIAAFAVPRIDITSYRVRSGMQSVASELMVAQRLAVTRQHDVIVTFDLSGDALFVHDDIDNNSAVGSGERRRRIPLGDAVTYGLGGASPHSLGANPINVTKLKGGMPALTFHRGGSASESVSFYLTSVRAVNTGGYSEDTKLVEVERSTGRVSWYRFSSGAWLRGF